MSLAVNLCVAKCHCTKCLTFHGTGFGGLLQLFNVHCVNYIDVGFACSLPRLTSAFTFIYSTLAVYGVIPSLVDTVCFLFALIYCQ